MLIDRADSGAATRCIQIAAGGCAFDACERDAPVRTSRTSASEGFGFPTRQVKNVPSSIPMAMQPPHTFRRAARGSQ